MRRSIMIALIALLALLMAAPMVAAQSQGGSPTDVSESPILLKKGAVFGNCEFPILLEYSGKASTLELPDGRFIFTSPKLTATLTNLETGEQVTLTITGAFHQTTLENGDVVTVVTGSNLLGDPDAGFVLAKGTFSYVFSEKGKLVQPLEGEGQLTDVCGLLS